MPKDLSLIYHILDLIGASVSRQIDIDTLKKYPQLEPYRDMLEEAKRHNDRYDAILKQIRRDLEQKK